MDTFYGALPILATFEDIVDRAVYRALPARWLIGLVDVVGSTEAVAQGRYKSVNLAGVAAISAIANAKGTLDFPYVFTGDGMACAIPPGERVLLEATLAMAVEWVGQALDLTLRAAIVPIEDIRAAGLDIRMARFAPATGIAYALFAGGGLAWAEAALKAGRLPQVQPKGGRPDLAGLSCRFEPIPSRHGLVLSMIVAPLTIPVDERYRTLIDDLLRLTRDGHPVPAGGPSWGWPPAGLGLEARLGSRPGLSRLLATLAVAARTLIAAVVIKLGLRVGHFVPKRYRAEIATHTDFRKFGDGLMMTVDCAPAVAAEIEAKLAEAEAAGIAVSGTHRQDAALMTCVVPSPGQPGHIHFVDGAGGGYTMAARQLKARRSTVDALRGTTQAASTVATGAAS